MRKAIVLFVFMFVLGVALQAGAQPVNWSVSEPEHISNLNIPFVSDTYFLANYSPNTAVVYVNGKQTDITIPPFSFRWVSFYVVSRTKIEAKTNEVTSGGIKVRKLKVRKSQTRDGRPGWLFQP